MTVPPEDFYPRSPCGERRILSDMANAVFEFLSTLSLRRATGIADAVALALDISIHALLAESDTSIRCSLNYYLAFLSTLSLRRATISPTGAGAPPHNFYPRSPCGERLYGFRLMMAVFLFLSTLSLRRATLMVVLLCHHISNFYPRSPCGERHFQFSPCPLLYGFLSTLSLWRATAKIKTRQRARKFLSTLSLRRATKGEEQDTKGKLFLSTLSLRRATSC